MEGSHLEHTSALTLFDLLFIVLTLMLLTAYLSAVYTSNKRFSSTWPWYRSLFWIAGMLTALAVMAGPLAKLSHTDFTIHMAGHLMLGMLAPLLLVLAAPMTLLLRVLPNQKARRITNLLRSDYIKFVSHPITASILNVGGLWLLYTTSLFELMHDYRWLHLLIHFHVFAAGYLFTAAMLYIDPVPHRVSYLYRSIVFIFALAAHQILSKYIYAQPPAGVSIELAETGAMIMYYGGDAIDLLIIFLLCLHWYRAARPRHSVFAHSVLTRKNV